MAFDFRHFFPMPLDVVSGAFRFTTRAVHKFRGERDVRVKLAATTAGIRGTDLWGKSEPTRDIFCLVEGSITPVPADPANVVSLKAMADKPDKQRAARILRDLDML